MRTEPRRSPSIRRTGKGRAAGGDIWGNPNLCRHKFASVPDDEAFLLEEGAAACNDAGHEVLQGTQNRKVTFHGNASERTRMRKARTQWASSFTTATKAVWLGAVATKVHRIPNTP